MTALLALDAPDQALRRPHRRQRDVSFAIAPGEVVGLLGPNGSGKTTVLNMISGALKPHRRRHPAERRSHRRPPCAPDRPPGHRPHLPAGPHPALAHRRRERRAALAFRAEPLWGAAARAEAEKAARHRRPRRPRRARPPTHLTYIDQKRVELARALAARPSLLLLDEWLAGLNPTELPHRHRPDRPPPRRRHHHPARRARHGGGARPLRPLHRHERRPARSPTARPPPCSPSRRSSAPIWGPAHA